MLRELWQSVKKLHARRQGEPVRFPGHPPDTEAPWPPSEISKVTFEAGTSGDRAGSSEEGKGRWKELSTRVGTQIPFGWGCWMRDASSRPYCETVQRCRHQVVPNSYRFVVRSMFRRPSAGATAAALYLSDVHLESGECLNGETSSRELCPAALRSSRRRAAAPMVQQATRPRVPQPEGGIAPNDIPLHDEAKARRMLGGEAFQYPAILVRATRVARVIYSSAEQPRKWARRSSQMSWSLVHEAVGIGERLEPSTSGNRTTSKRRQSLSRPRNRWHVVAVPAFPPEPGNGPCENQ